MWTRFQHHSTLYNEMAFLSLDRATADSNEKIRNLDLMKRSSLYDAFRALRWRHVQVHGYHFRNNGKASVTSSHWAAKDVTQNRKAAHLTGKTGTASGLEDSWSPRT